MPAPLDRQPPITDLPPPAVELVNDLLRRLQGSDEVPVTGKTERRMLFAASSFARSVNALQRACELASRCNGRLFVLHVATRDMLRTQSEDRIRNEAHIARAALRGLRGGVERGLSDLLPDDQVLVRHGDFARSVARTARELDADLVVIPGAEGQKGATVARIASEAAMPVLVARKAARGGRILAATDLADAGCSELRQAARLAHRLQGELTFLHNVKPVVHASGSALGQCMCAVMEPSAQSVEECRGRLLALASYFGVPAETMVLTRPSAEEAILQTAQASNADVIVVGARRKSWFERLFGSALAARIVDRAEQSVLVTPIGIAGRLELSGPMAA